MTASARSIPTQYQLELTEALRRGDGRVEQCSWCGLLVATTSGHDVATLGPCPACGGTTWWRQTLPVGPFRAARRAPVPPAPVCASCGRPESESPGFIRYASGPFCLACRKALVGEVG